jgi:putative MATE family efflux protein
MNDKELSRRELILEGNLWKAIILLAVPAAINDFIRALYDLIDALFVANIGSMEVAAITFVGPLNTFILTMSVGLSVAGTNLVAREIGRKDFKKAKNVAMQLLVIGFIMGLVIAVVSFFYSKQILLSAFATESILDTANSYFRLTVLSSPFIFINAIYIGVKRAEGNTLKAMNLNLVAMGLKILVSYILIYHVKLGIQSLAISTFIGSLFVSAYGLYDLFYEPGIMKLSKEDLFFSKAFLLGLFLIATPVIIEKSAISFSFIIVNKYVIDYGELVLAGYGITNRINSLVFATVTGFATGLSPIVSQNLGAGNVDRVRSAIKKTYIMALIIATVIISCLLPFKTNLASVFAKGNQEIIYHAVNAMSVYAISVIPWAVFQVSNGVFQGTGHTKYNMIISIARIYVFRLPLVIVFSKYTDLAEYSIWYSILLSNCLTGVFAFALYLFHRKDLRLAGE